MSDTASVTVGPKGRIVIPSAIRTHLGLLEGSELVALVEDDALVLLPREAVKRRLRALFVGTGPNLRAQLIAERRAAAAEESRR